MSSSSSCSSYTPSKKRLLNEGGDREDGVGSAVLSVCEEMSPFLRGRVVCKEKDLTREKMLAYLIAIGHVAVCDDVLRLTVETVDADQQDIVVEVPMGVTTSSVAAVKKRISVLLGFPTEKQSLFYADSDTPLLDGHVIDRESSARPLILMLGPTTFAWDANSPHMDNAAARKIERKYDFDEDRVREWKFDDDVVFVLDRNDPRTVRRRRVFVHQFHWHHTMVAVPSMTEVVGTTFTLSVSLKKNRNLTFLNGDPTGSGGREWPRIGIVTVGSYAVGDSRPLIRNATVSASNSTVSAWNINTLTGALNDAPTKDHQWGRTTQGFGCQILPTESSVLTMKLDFDRRTLRFWVDGVPLGEGFDDIPQVPMQWALLAPHCDSAVTIVDTPAALK
jgi:hypothetical protein